MAVTTLDTHELVKELKSAGFSDEQAEAVTRAVQRGRAIDLSDLATKADFVGLKSDIAVLEAKMANFATKAELSDMRTDIVKWVFGIALGQAAMIVALLKLLPGGHP